MNSDPKSHVHRLLIVVVLVVLSLHLQPAHLAARARAERLVRHRVQLKRRADLVPNLVRTVKRLRRPRARYSHAVTQARTKQWRHKRGSGAAAVAENELTDCAARTHCGGEAYPQLQHRAGFAISRHQLATIEDSIAELSALLQRRRRISYGSLDDSLT